MRITELLTEATIDLNLSASSKSDTIDEMVKMLDRAGKLSNADRFKRDILKREEHTTTGIGDGVAIPHAKSNAVKQPAIAFARSQSGVDYDALDGQDSHLIFMIAATEGANNEHLDTLARLSSMLMDTSFRQQLLDARDEADILSIIDRKENEKQAEDDSSSEQHNRQTILAVTGCPTGIAHTFMAADALKDKAKELNINMKVETRGSGGAKNVLTDEEIQSADAIIIAADTKVDRDRFGGKVLIEAGVTDGIHKPEELIKQALAPNAPIHSAEGNHSSSPRKQGNAFYRHLMNGVSHMLPFVVGGGILIALGFLFDIEAHVPDSPTYHPFAEALNTIGGGNAFGLMVPVLAGFIAMSIADRPGLAPGMVGGFLAAQGESGFLGGLIAGFLAGYLILGFKALFKNLPASLEGIKTILIYPVLGIFTTGMLMYYVIEIPIGAFNLALGEWLQGMGTTNAVLLGIILGGMMAVDMGGPVNKAAYTFGIAMIAEGFLTPHAAIMAGGMVPPLGIAIATLIFKNRFTREELDAGKSNFVMGASFITEGAIPFAAADPGRVIPSLITGSAVAGGLSMIFNIGLPAPHGGIFVIGLVEGSAFLYFLAILIGSIVTALLLGILKKPIKN
ncbi:PTS system D-fructose-specific IIA component (F1P-forming), Frc family /PTS system D-fructose-specific IIB component (F1P-forming), Frc family /PTS system D-fructose-specific IIC component (F1P-forming), Frc family [Pelagirhabdus alkalitolerans]|uniref:PTS system D-fructose-specific IIA component (F1P-forming), Frc family /PTS system D-fructose-specific IIB component (F1P-forming), Frc family /PTS system D-fructose-specific IIC component (F1P-for... n=1 Tax=Pelagirhabdus alkalitolerans TaxID=1612202 RepID=A0A1G6MR07_9BACI|nr:PTS fructose transporter subunit IIABC [Pelagirhabdus alkalitolerans]SDC57942.1 PTS system D-fructose-specific IIA component (F1P-forming), Frc family /PTS system D-fructose-specific IIB component (F1P-forming), Frc family /PTS system D-fructose-specific IIC component (F1P-forming), Frc family [Pelagirhabdus alkalitolerans]